MTIPEDPSGMLSGGTVFLFNKLALAACEEAMKRIMACLANGGKYPVDFFVLEDTGDVSRVLAARTPKNLVLVLHEDNEETKRDVGLGDPDVDGGEFRDYADRSFPLHYQLRAAKEGEDVALGIRFMSSRNLVAALAAGPHTPACIVMHYRASIQDSMRLFGVWDVARGSPPVCMAWEEPVLVVRQPAPPEEEVAIAAATVGRLSRQTLVDEYLMDWFGLMVAWAPVLQAKTFAAGTTVPRLVLNRTPLASHEDKATRDLVRRIACVNTNMCMLAPREMEAVVDTCASGIFGDFVAKKEAGDV